MRRRSEEEARQARYEAALRQAESPQQWFVRTGGPLGLRAQKILDGIAASVRRYEAVMVAKQGPAWENHPRNYVVYCDWEFEVRVREKTTASPRSDHPRSSRERYVGTGKLCVDVDHEYAKWIDGRKPLEERVDVVADYLDRHLNRLRVGWNKTREEMRARQALAQAAEEEEARRYRESNEYEYVLARICGLHQQMADELSKLRRPSMLAQEPDT